VFLEKDITKADDENRNQVDYERNYKNINITKTTVAFHIPHAFFCTFYI